MKFILDAQLPVDLISIFVDHSCECIHVNTLPNKDRSKDSEIRDFADLNNFIVVTKDFDFYHSHMSTQRPAKLLLITTGNIKNKDLIHLVRRNLGSIKKAFESCHFVELSNTELIAL
jgi:predicted nuclease of predicted toxin-antitoxin system